MKNCKSCNQEFQTTPDRTLFCEHACYLRFISVALKECDHCGKGFKTYSKYKGRGKFCSRVCFNEFRKKRSVLTFDCLNCGKKFDRLGWRVKAENQRPKFCGTNCYRNFQRTNPPSFGKAKIDPREYGKLVTLYESGLKMREIAERYDVSYTVMRGYFKRIGVPVRQAGFYSAKQSEQFLRNYLNGKYVQTCRVCGWNKGKCDVHHIVPRRDGGSNELSNVVLICPNCHRLAEEGTLTAQELKTIG